MAGGGCNATGGAHPSIFRLRARMQHDPMHVAIAASLVVALTLLMEHVFHVLETRARRRPAIFAVIGKCVMKELMILGLISFFIFIANQAFHLNATAFYLPLEFA